MAPALLAVVAIGTVLSATMSIIQGVQAREAGEANAEALEQRGQTNLAIGQENARRQRLVAQLTQESSIASAGGAGGGLGGSIADELAFQAQQDELKALDLIFQSQVSQGDVQLQSAIALQQGNQAFVGGLGSATSTIVGGIGLGAQIGGFGGSGDGDGAAPDFDEDTP